MFRRTGTAIALAVVASSLVAQGAPAPGVRPAGVARPGAAMDTPSAIRLEDGRVLVVSGVHAELYDPAADRWIAGGRLAHARPESTLAILPGGHVLVAGDADHWRTVEIFDPAEGTWRAAASMHVGRFNHRTTRLLDGSVLVTGGEGVASLPGVLRTFFSIGPVPLASAEVYEAAADRWRAVPGLSEERHHHSATLLADGRVLVAGGRNHDGVLASAEVFEPKTLRWSPAAPLRAPRTGHTAVRLTDGRVLVVGGEGSGFADVPTAEVWDPERGSWSGAGRLVESRAGAPAVALAGGGVLVAGGVSYGPKYTHRVLDGVEVFDPRTGLWRTAGRLAHLRSGHVLVPLSPDRVLAIGGSSASAAEVLVVPSP